AVADKYDVPGGQLQLFIYFANLGNETAEGVTLTETLPTGTSYVTSNGGCGACGSFSGVPNLIEGNQLIFNLGSLNWAGTGYIYLTLQLGSGLQPGTTLDEIANLTGTGTEANPQDNTNYFAAVIQTPTVDLALTNTANGFCASFPCQSPGVL